MLLLRRTGRIFAEKTVSSCGLMGVALVFLAGCQKTNPIPSPTPASPSKVSSIRVNVTSDRIHIQSPVAAFELSPTGYLKATLMRDGQSFTLDDPGTHAGQHITVAGKQISDFSLDLAPASITDATGKIGKTGKHIEI